MTCRKCKYLDVRANNGGRVVPKRDGLYKCLAPIPDLRLVLPRSVTVGTPRHMSPEDGEGCPTFALRAPSSVKEQKRGMR